MVITMMMVLVMMPVSTDDSDARVQPLCTLSDNDDHDDDAGDDDANDDSDNFDYDHDDDDDEHGIDDGANDAGVNNGDDLKHL